MAGDMCSKIGYLFRPIGFPRGGGTPGEVLFGGKVDIGGLILGSKWTFVLYPMEPLDPPDPTPSYGPGTGSLAQSLKTNKNKQNYVT